MVKKLFKTPAKYRLILIAQTNCLKADLICETHHQCAKNTD